MNSSHTSTSTDMAPLLPATTATAPYAVSKPSKRAAPKASALATVLLILLFSTVAFAQTEVEVSSHVDRDTLNPGDTLTYEINASVAGHFDLDIAAEPGLDDFTVHGQMTAPSYRVVNGSPHRSLRREYRIRAPHQPGTYTISAPTFRIGDREFSPEDHTVEVVDDGRARATPENTDSDRADERAFVEASLSPDRNPYVGEQITVDYTLYTHHRERRLRPRGPDQPALDGFWVEDISRHVRRQRGRVQRYGDFWYTTPIYAYVLFPISAGSAEIDPLEISLYRVSTFDRELEMVAKSDPIELDIRPLPDGAPDGFSSGNVGHFEFEIHVDTDDIAAGDQMRLTAHIDGIGRVERLGAPTFDVPNDLRLLSTDESYSQTIEGERLGGRRTVEYRLMPLEEGPTEIPPLSFTYFDPDEAEYVTLHSDPIEFDVAPGDVPVLPDPVDDDLQRATPELADDPLAKLHALLPPATIDVTDAGDLPVATWLIALPLTALLLLLFGPVIARPILHRLSPTFRRRALRRRIDEELRGDDDAPSRCLRALQLCLREGLDLTVGALTTEDVAAALVDTDLPDELATHLTDLVERLVQARYAPQESSSSEDDTLIEDTKALITSLLDYCFGGDENNSSKTAEKMASIVAIATAGVLMGIAASPATADATPPEDDAFEQLDETPEEWADLAESWALRAQEEPADPTTHFNAGTASANAGDLAAARLHLERAYMAAPGDSVVRHNLDLVTRTVASQSDQAAFAAQSPTARTFRSTGPYIAVALLWLAMALAALYRLTGRPRSRAAFTGLMTTLVVATTALALLWLHIENFPGDAELAIVTADEVQLYQAPSPHSESVVDTLPAGSAILIHQRRDGWLDAELPSGHNGWLKIDAAAPVTSP